VKTENGAIVRAKWFLWVEKILEARPCESWFEIVRKFGVFLAEMMKEGSGEISEVEMI